MQGIWFKINSKGALLIPITNVEIAKINTSFLAIFLAANTYLHNDFSDHNFNRWPGLGLVWQVCFDSFLNHHQ